MKLKALLFCALTLALLAFPDSVNAVSCSSVPISGNYTVSASCEFANTVDGVDSGAGTSNSAIITVNNGVTLTVASGQTIAWGGITLNGTIVITRTPSSGAMKKSPIWMTDADSDNYSSSTTQIIQTTQPANGRRRNLMATVSSTDCSAADANIYRTVGSTATDADQDGYYTGASGSNCVGDSTTVSGRTYYKATGGSYTWLASGGALGTTDCNESDATLAPSRTWYTDADGDGYTLTGGSGECETISTWGNSACSTAGSDYAKNSATTCRRITSSGTDCYDSNATARPNQTSYFTSNRGDSSFDYDCSGATEANATEYCTGTFVSDSFYDLSNCTNSIAGLTRYLVNPTAVSGNTGCGQAECHTKYYCSGPYTCDCSAASHGTGATVGCR